MSDIDYSKPVDLSEGRMHETMYTVGVGTIGPDVTVDSKAKLIGMRLVNNGSLVEMVLRSQTLGKIITRIVPITNFSSATVSVRPLVILAPPLTLVTNAPNSKT